MIIIDTETHPRKIRLYCIKNRYGSVDCSVTNIMLTALNKLSTLYREANVIHISEDGKYLTLDFSVPKNNPEIKTVEFSVMCDVCSHSSDPFLGPSDSSSHIDNCERIGNDSRHVVWLQNSINADTINLRIKS